MKRKVICLVLVFVMVMASYSGCNKKTTTSSQSKTKDDILKEIPKDENGEIAVDAFKGTTLHIAAERPYNFVLEDFNEKPAFKMAEEATGIHVEWEYIDNETKNEIVTLKLSSGKSELPEAFYGPVSVEQVAANEELFPNLLEDDMLQTYAPKVYDDIKNSMSGLQLVTWPDGSIKGLPMGMDLAYTNTADAIRFINKKWLDKLGMDLPVTTDDFYKVLKAFKDNDMDGDGDPNNEIPFTFCESSFYQRILNIAEAFGIASERQPNSFNYRMLRDGKMIPVLETEDYRKFLEYTNKLYKDGLIDKEGFSQKKEQYMSKLNSGIVGCFDGWTMPDAYKDDYVALNPIVADGYTPIKKGNRHEKVLKTTGFLPTVNTENLPALLHWWNYLSSTTEMKWTVRYGVEGGAWDIKDGQVIQHAVRNKPEGMDDETYYASYGCIGDCPFMLPSEAPKIENDGTMTYIRQEAVDQVFEFLSKESFPQRIVSPESIQERTAMETDIVSAADSFMGSSIVNGVTDETWDKFQKELKGLGYKDWVQWWQDYYDGTLE